MAISVKKSGNGQAKPGTQTPSWAKRGKAAQKEAVQYDKDSQKHWEEKNRMWRFMLKPGESGRITFVDGDLLPDGTIDLLTYREHTVKVNGDWMNFVCIQEQEPCPICEGGDFPALVGVATVIDHRSYQGKKGVYKDQQRLFVAKKGTIKLLQQHATKREGLAGATFEISRLGEQDPMVGGSLDFEKKRSIAECKKAYMRKGRDGNTTTVFVPADYEKEINYLSAAELREHYGFGKGGRPIGSETASDAEAAGEEAGRHM